MRHPFPTHPPIPTPTPTPTLTPGSGADFLVERGVAVATVRKSAQGLAFLGPALCLLWGSQATDDAGIVASMTLALGLASFSLGGLYSNHADLSPRYAPILLGMTNVAGAVPGIVGIAGTGEGLIPMEEGGGGGKGAGAGRKTVAHRDRGGARVLPWSWTQARCTSGARMW